MSLSCCGRMNLNDEGGDLIRQQVGRNKKPFHGATRENATNFPPVNLQMTNSRLSTYMDIDSNRQNPTPDPFNSGAPEAPRIGRGKTPSAFSFPHFLWKASIICVALLIIPNIIYKENKPTMLKKMLLISAIFATIMIACPRCTLSYLTNSENLGPGLRRPPVSYSIYAKGIFENSTETEIDTNMTDHNDFVFGVKGPRDHLLIRTTVYRRPKIWSNHVTKEFTFPPPRSSAKVTIAQVKAHYKGSSGTGGVVKIIGGGIGKENIVILFISHKHKAIHYDLEIYGRRK